MARQASASAQRPLDETVRVLILCGPELMLQREALEELRGALQARHGTVEPRVFDGASAALAEVLDELRTQSLLSSYRLVVVDDAGTFVKNHREAMERYAQQPVEDATLVLRATAWHPGKLDKMVEKVGAVRRCDPLRDAQAVAWLHGRAKQQKADIQPQAAAALVQRLGTDLTRLDSELGKLAALAGGNAIDPGMVEALVGRSSDEQAWVVQEAVLAGIAGGNGGKTAMGAAITKVHELVEVGGQPDVLVLYWVGDVFRKLYQAATMRRQGATMGSICQALRLWGAKAELMGRALGRVGPQAAGSFLIARWMRIGDLRAVLAELWRILKYFWRGWPMKWDSYRTPGPPHPAPGSCDLRGAGGETDGERHGGPVVIERSMEAGRSGRALGRISSAALSCAILAAATVNGCSLFESAGPTADGGRAVATRAQPQPQAEHMPEAPTPQPMLTDAAELYADRVSQSLNQRPAPTAPTPDVLWVNQRREPQPQPAQQGQAVSIASIAPQPMPAPPTTATTPLPTTPSVAQSPATQLSTVAISVPSTQTSVAAAPTLKEAPADAPALVGRLAACIDNDEQGAMAKAVRLANLRLVEPEAVPDPQAVAGLDESQRQSILLYQQLMGRLAEKLKNGELFSRELVLKQADLLPLAQPLHIRTLRLCRRVQGFGAYEPLETSSLLAGSDHPMIVYLELEDFRSVPLDVDRHEVKLAQEVSLYSEADGLAVWRQPRAEIVDESRNARRDFFVVQQIELPARLTVGKYLLKVRVTDLHARTIAEDTCALQIVADPALASAQK